MTSTSTSTQLLSSDTREFEFSVALRPQRAYGLFGTGSPPGRPPQLSHSSRALNSCFFKYCYTSTETVRTITDAEPRTSTSTFTQLLSSDTREFEFKIALRPQRAYGILGSGAHDVHLVFYTAPEMTFASSMLLYVHRDRTVYLGREVQDGHLDIHTVPELSWSVARTNHFYNQGHKDGREGARLRETGLIEQIEAGVKRQGNSLPVHGLKRVSSHVYIGYVERLLVHVQYVSRFLRACNR